MKMRFLITLLVLFLVAGCGVTETGNPCPGGDCGGVTSAPTLEDQSIYENTQFGIRIPYSDQWTADEAADGNSVTFTHSGTPATTALFEFERIDPAPQSLLLYLQEKYPDRAFHVFSTYTSQGYCYDDTSPGPNNGDAAEYFFLNVDVLVHVSAEVFTMSQTDFVQLLKGMTFE
ncbi:MAG: hypothetical protein WC956_06515 [bacterium]